VGEIRNASIAISAISEHPENYRRHPDEQVERLQASLARFGQVRSVVVQEGAPGKYLMVAGHGVMKAAIEEELTELRADIIPADWSPEQVAGYLIADNMGGAEDDRAALAKLLSEQRDQGFDLASLGSSEDELDTLLAELRALDGIPDFDALVDPSGGGESSDMSWHVTVTIDDPDQRDELVAQLREMGYTPEVTSVRALV